MKEGVAMSAVKTGVSIRGDLAKQADDLAEELKVSRSRLYAMALSEFIERHKNRRLLERLNEVYADGPTDEEKELLERAKDYRRDRFGSEE
jgi:metal-responsive CopG/Arc/MetJ family transcriptional regulator